MGEIDFDKIASLRSNLLVAAKLVSILSSST